MTRVTASDLKRMSESQVVSLINKTLGRLDLAESTLLELADRITLLEKRHPEK
jgi:hypothetical protein